MEFNFCDEDIDPVPYYDTHEESDPHAHYDVPQPNDPTEMGNCDWCFMAGPLGVTCDNDLCCGYKGETRVGRYKTLTIGYGKIVHPRQLTHALLGDAVYSASCILRRPIATLGMLRMKRKNCCKTPDVDAEHGECRTEECHVDMTDFVKEIKGDPVKHVDLIVEATKKSGTLITSKFALDYNKEIFAIPGSPLDSKSQGTNELLKQGANLALYPSDIIKNLGKLIEENNNLIFDNVNNFKNTNLKNLPSDLELNLFRIVLKWVFIQIV